MWRGSRKTRESPLLLFSFERFFFGGVSFGGRSLFTQTNAGDSFPSSRLSFCCTCDSSDSIDSKGEAIKRALLSTLRLRLEERNRWPPPTADSVRITSLNVKTRPKLQFTRKQSNAAETRLFVNDDQLYQSIRGPGSLYVVLHVQWKTTVRLYCILPFESRVKWPVREHLAASSGKMAYCMYNMMSVVA